MDFIETIINGIRTWVSSELTKLRQLVTSTRSIAEKAQKTAAEAKSAVDAKADVDSPVFTGSFSQNRAPFGKVGESSHAEGSYNTASGTCSHAEGNGNTASGQYSHAEGQSVTASGYCGHAEGHTTNANGRASHAEGQSCAASDEGAHAEGGFNTATGKYSHAEGCYNTAYAQASHVQGRYSLKDTSGKYAHIVGNGTSYQDSGRSNAHTLDWEGNAWFQGEVYVGGTSQDDGSQTVMANGDTEIILTSSTPDSTKKFKITVDDTGTLTATEVTE